MDCKLQKVMGGSFGKFGRKADRELERYERDNSPITNMVSKGKRKNLKKVERLMSSETIVDQSRKCTKSLLSGLNTPMINKVINLSGGFLYKTSFGYYK